QKAVSLAKRKMIVVTLKGTTIFCEVTVKYGAARIMLKPAPEGTGIIAGGAIRVVLEAAGVRNASAKIMGTKNKITNVYATMEALEKISSMRSKKEAR
ncbi:MAG TPA: 30S ribosomal protein S5, partial [Candidatus Saccharimonadales bacterium]|nr:30S ribosomal protein S5 [Candidatus Saccharimonadales bacterium]